MPITLEVRGQTTRITVFGTITYQDGVDYLAWRASDPTRIPNLPVLIDARGVERLPSASELRLLAADLRPLVDAGLGPIAVLTGASWMYGVMRMFSVFAQAMSAEVSAHREMEDAELWLAEQRQAV